MLTILIFEKYILFFGLFDSGKNDWINLISIKIISSSYPYPIQIQSSFTIFFLCCTRLLDDLENIIFKKNQVNQIVY